MASHNNKYYVEGVLEYPCEKGEGCCGLYNHVPHSKEITKEEYEKADLDSFSNGVFYPFQFKKPLIKKPNNGS